jgi:arabinofuranan 3-O-arabinosyltransferase
VNGTVVATRVSGTFTDLLNGRPMPFTACTPVSLAAGTNRVTEPQSDAFDIQDLVLTRHAVEQAETPAAATVVSWGPSERKLRVAADTRSYLVVNENFNSGWRAVLGGRTLSPVRLDGWKQAWVLPAGSAGLVTLTYQPETWYLYAVAGGLAALAVVIGFAAVLSRRRRGPPQPWTQPEPDKPARWPGLTAGCVILAGAGLLLGGYPGAVLLPAAALAFTALARRGHGAATPWLLASLLAVAAACGAVGEHLALSGAAGLIVSAPANAIPQVICLIVVGGLAAALIRRGGEPVRPREETPTWQDTVK